MSRGPIAPIVVAMLVNLAVGGLSFVLLFHDHALAAGAVLIGDCGLLHLFDRWYRRRWPRRSPRPVTSHISPRGPRS